MRLPSIQSKFLYTPLHGSTITVWVMRSAGCLGDASI